VDPDDAGGCPRSPPGAPSAGFLCPSTPMVVCKGDSAGVICIGVVGEVATGRLDQSLDWHGPARPRRRSASGTAGEACAQIDDPMLIETQSEWSNSTRSIRIDPFASPYRGRTNRHSLNVIGRRLL
jgi:hypothetical protein